MVTRKDKLSQALDSMMTPGGTQAAETKTVLPEGKQPVGLTVKATYYVSKELTRRLKYLAADTDRDLSNLVNEAIQELLIKYGK